MGGVRLPLKHVLRRASLRVSLVFLAVTLGTVACVAPSGAASSRPAHGVPIAAAARTLSLSLNVNMHLIGRPGHILNEQGSVSGTLPGSVSSRSTTLSSTQGTSTFTFYTKDGSIFGQADTHGRVVGANVYLTGTATITGGSGSWAHASGSGLQYSGVISRQNFHVTEHINGSIRY